MDQQYGPVPVETLEWAAKLVDQWDKVALNDVIFHPG